MYRNTGDGCRHFLRHDVNGLHVRGDLVAATVRHGAGTDGQHFPFWCFDVEMDVDETARKIERKDRISQGIPTPKHDRFETTHGSASPKLPAISTSFLNNT